MTGIRAQQVAANASSNYSWTNDGLSDDKPTMMVLVEVKEHQVSIKV